MSVAVPFPYEDEILFSAVARYGRQSGISGWRRFLRSLFGYDYMWGKAIPDVVTFCEQTVDYLNLTTDEVRKKLTLYPYYAAWMKRERIERLLDLVASHQPTHHVLDNPKMVRVFRFCEQCMAGDYSADRLPYWRRSHQLPGVVVCRWHGCLLRQYSTVAKNPSYIPLPDEIFDDSDLINLMPEPASMISYLRIAKAAGYILDCGDTALSADLEKQYRAMAFYLGFGNGKIMDYRGFLTALENHFGRDYFCCVGYDRGVADMGRLFKREMTPISAVLVGVFLCCLLSSGCHDKWPVCSNPFAAHGAGFRVNVLRRRGMRREVQCKCGMVYKTGSDGQVVGVALYSPDYAVEAARLHGMGLSTSQIGAAMQVPGDTVRRWIVDGPPSNRPSSEMIAAKISQWERLVSSCAGLYAATRQDQRLAFWVKRWCPEAYRPPGYERSGINDVGS